MYSTSWLMPRWTPTVCLQDLLFPVVRTLLAAALAHFAHLAHLTLR
ncbi:hypothetical protein Afil01_22280 [Actinorhabdospora filicis]|uniref:Uncharacterized protein n=1 Tax=Actinorhabdospora filicis TaxID=1785913 RepID=A0A9W6W9D7_9ACTN|nr:hypothetical protein [Actinorhabdospora filicis]GLZ77421.1 hypothetical protein Afil01_22280 [Actinorhabdospora filicis]